MRKQNRVRLSDSEATPARVFADRLYEARSRRGLSQQDVANLTRELGHAISRPVLTRLENGTRRPTLDDVLVVAAALGTAPINLITPRDEPVMRVGSIELPARTARAWVRGDARLEGRVGDPVAFLADFPPEELEALLAAHLEHGMSPVTRALMADRTSEKAEDLAWELTEGEQQRRKSRREEK